MGRGARRPQSLEQFAQIVRFVIREMLSDRRLDGAGMDRPRPAANRFAGISHSDHVIATIIFARLIIGRVDPAQRA